MSPRVLNAKNISAARRVSEERAGRQVYVGRPTKWGNPFVIGRDGSRDEVIEKYRAMLDEAWDGRGHPLLKDLGDLTGRDLVCWCAPEPCHADVLLELANA